MTNIPSAREILEKAAKTIREMGFRVFLTNDMESAFGYFNEGRDVAYFQASVEQVGVQLATVSRTPGSAGMGFLLEPDAKAVPLKGLTLDGLRKGFAYYPDYFSKEDRAKMPVQKYENLEEFLSCRGSGDLYEVR